MVNEFIPSQKGLKEIELDGEHITEIYIDGEYFRPKFEAIFEDNGGLLHDGDYDYVINKLIECLKNPEKK